MNARLRFGAVVLGATLLASSGCGFWFGLPGPYGGGRGGGHHRRHGRFRCSNDLNYARVAPAPEERPDSLGS